MKSANQDHSIQTEPPYTLLGGDYLYCLTEDNAEKPASYKMQICNPASGEILFEMDDLSEERSVAEALLKLLADEQVEPGDQAEYIIYDYLAKISTIIH